MTFPPSNPMSISGQLESQISDVKSSLYRKADKYEINTLNSNISDLACSIRELSSVVDRLLSRLQTCEERINELQSL